MHRLLLLLLLSCASRYDFGLGKCAAADSCPSGSTCRFDECILDHSQLVGQTCSASAQCREGLFCPAGIPLCSRPCTAIHSLYSECGQAEVCVPVPDRDNNGKFTGGACVPTECPLGADGDAYCQQNDGFFTTANAGNGCIPLARNGGLCLLRCQVGIRKANAANGVDLCISDRRANPHHCGRVASGDFVCVPAGSLTEGQACAIFPSATEETCSLNVVDNKPQLPLVCLDHDGGVAGNLQCRVAACTTNTDCPLGQTCSTKAGLQFCL